MMTFEQLVALKTIAYGADEYFEMCPLNWRTQETGQYSYSKYEEKKEANMEFSKRFGPAVVKQLIDLALLELARQAK